MLIIKKYIAPIIFLLGSFLSGFLYQINDQFVDESGILRESFVFIPIGWLCFFGAIISFLLVYFKNRK